MIKYLFYFIFSIFLLCDSDIKVSKNILNPFNKIELFNFYIKLLLFLLNTLNFFFKILLLFLSFSEKLLNIINLLLILFLLLFLLIFYASLFKVLFNNKYLNNN